MNNLVDKWWFRLPLVILATLRAIRFITQDNLGEWWIVGPAKQWAHRHESGTHVQMIVDRAVEAGDAVLTPNPANGWRSKLVKGLDCPFCVGFWIGGLILLGEVLTKHRPFRWARPLWTFALGMLALNEVVGHVSSRIDG